jgi:hypothetical protein
MVTMATGILLEIEAKGFAASIIHNQELETARAKARGIIAALNTQL